jgi:hypothetical protein
MGIKGCMMGIGEGLLVAFILLLAVFSGATHNSSSSKYVEKPEEDPNLKRLRQMAEWDRFDDTKK